MIKSEQDFPEEKELLGYKKIKDDYIRCGNCNKKIVNIIKVKDTDRKNYITVSCPFCGDKSYKYEISGVVYIGTVTEDLEILDCEVDSPVENTFVTMLKIRKKQ